MPFGIGDKHEDVRTSELGAILNSLFDKKLGRLEARASGIVKELQRSKAQFSESCRNFEELKVEPEKWNIYIDNVSFIKSQKGFYSNALRHVIEAWNIGVGDAPNIHNKYALALANTEEFINGILKTNEGYKKFLYSYSSHLDPFRKFFLAIERQRDSLRNELDKTGQELAEYNQLSELISKLSILNEQYDETNSSISAVNENMISGNSNVIGEEETKISADISKKKEELDALNKERSALTNKIRLVTMPLERPARKFDHASQKKRPLHAFIMDPIGGIGNESDYNEFVGLLEELRRSLGSGTVDMKSNAKIEEEIAELIRTNIYEISVRLKMLSNKKSELEGEIRSLDIIINRLRENESSSARAMRDIESMKRELMDIGANRAVVKGRIESLFLGYYNRRLSVVI